MVVAIVSNNVTSVSSPRRKSRRLRIRWFGSARALSAQSLVLVGAARFRLITFYEGSQIEAAHWRDSRSQSRSSRFAARASAVYLPWR